MIERFFSGIGVDVSEHHVRIAQMSFFGSSKVLHEIVIPEGLVVDEKVVKPEALKKLITQEVLKLPIAGKGIPTTLLAPESRVFSTSFLLPKRLRGDALMQASRALAQKDIPMPFSKSVESASQGASEGDGYRTTLYAVEKEVLEKLQFILEPEDFRISAIEANTKASLRLFSRYGKAELKPKNNKEYVGVVDVGHSWATISVYSLAGSNMYSRTISFSGAKEGATEKALSQQTVDMIVESVKETVVFFSKRDRKISILVLAGMEGMDKNLTKTLRGLKLKTPISTISEAVKMNGQPKEKIQKFSAAMGAGLRSAHLRKYAYQHNLLSEEL